MKGDSYTYDIIFIKMFTIKHKLYTTFLIRTATEIKKKQ
jgi:hypothetical protein